MKLIAAAIVIAGALIAGALYLALSPRAVVPQSPPPIAGDPSRSALEALASFKPGLHVACWPADAGTRTPSRWTLDLTFDATGAQIARGFREERDAQNSDVTHCVEQYLPALHIPPPGRSARVEVPFTLP